MYIFHLQTLAAFLEKKTVSFDERVTSISIHDIPHPLALTLLC